MGSLGSRLFSRIRSVTLIEWLIIVAIVAIIVTPLLPETPWASSGDIEIPVRVAVFNATTFEPIENAKVTIIRLGPAGLEGGLPEFRDRFQDVNLESYPFETTQRNGLATIDCEFTTGASHKNPTPRALTGFYWGVVIAKGYGAVATPVRYESTPTATLREAGEMRVSVGLYPTSSPE